ncbi:hypothetical protein AAFN88_12865 [Pelagibius sp. CAU 1746]|uniref:hypothetical protein n=1 Tax=Pelagibius sp. CAU 1746 TaxID=3140370 RepID=UPI00325A9FE7
MGFLINPARFIATGSAEWTLEQSAFNTVNAYSTGQETLAAVFGSAPTEGNLIVACYASTDSGYLDHASPSINDLAVAIDQALNMGSPDNDFLSNGIHYKVAGASETSTFTMDFGVGNGQDNMSLFLMEWSGNASSGLLEGTPGSASLISGTKQTTSSSGSTTTSNNNCLLVASHGVSEGPISFSWNNGFVSRREYGLNVTGVDIGHGVATKIADAASHSTVLTMSGGGGAAFVGGAIAAFNSA